MATAGTAGAETEKAAPQAEPAKTVSEEVRQAADTIARSERNIQLRAAELATANSAWGKTMNEKQRAALEEIAARVGLSTALGHIIVMGGNFYLTLSGHLTLAHKEGFLGFEEGPLPKAEYEAWGIPKDTLFAWKAATRRKDNPEVVYQEVGWSGPSRDGSQPVAKGFPGEMARKRARARVLALAFPVGIPSVEEIQRGEEIPEEFLKRAHATIQQPKRLSETAPEPAAAIPEAGEEAAALHEANMFDMMQEGE